MAPSVNEILIRTSPECLCSRMRNMEKKMEKEWGDLLSIFGGLIPSHNGLKFSGFLCFPIYEFLLLGVFYHPPLYNFYCE